MINVWKRTEALGMAGATVRLRNKKVRKLQVGYRFVKPGTVTYKTGNGYPVYAHCDHFQLISLNDITEVIRWPESKESVIPVWVKSIVLALIFYFVVVLWIIICSNINTSINSIENDATSTTCTETE